MAALLIKNTCIASEDSDELVDADVLVESGVITRIGQGIEPSEGIREIEAEGRILMPTMFDTHVHMREPGQDLPCASC